MGFRKKSQTFLHGVDICKNMVNLGGKYIRLNLRPKYLSPTFDLMKDIYPSFFDCQPSLTRDNIIKGLPFITQK